LHTTGNPDLAMPSLCSVQRVPRVHLPIQRPRSRTTGGPRGVPCPEGEARRTRNPTPGGGLSPAVGERSDCPSRRRKQSDAVARLRPGLAVARRAKARRKIARAIFATASQAATQQLSTTQHDTAPVRTRLQ
jgi:hypothetical protein